MTEIRIERFHPGLTAADHPAAGDRKPAWYYGDEDTIPGVYGVPPGWRCVAIAEGPWSRLAELIPALLPEPGSRALGVWSCSGAWTKDPALVAIGAYLPDDNAPVEWLNVGAEVPLRRGVMPPVATERS